MSLLADAPELWFREANRYCYSCFKRLAKLQQCSKCKIAVYCDSQCQKENWRFHKRSCSDSAECASRPSDSGNKLIETLQETRLMPSPRLVAHLLAIRSQIFADEQPSEIDEWGFELHTLTRVYLNSEAEANTYYRLLWAVPGMPELLLNDPVVPDSMRRAKEDDDSDYDCDHKAPYNWSFLLFNLLCRTVTLDSVQGMSNMACSIGGGQSGFRVSPMFDVALDRVLWLYANCFEFCGDALNAGPGVVLQLSKQEHRMPQLLEAGALKAIAGDILQHGASRETAKEALKSIASQPAALRAMSVGRSTEALSYILSEVDCIDKTEDEGVLKQFGKVVASLVDTKLQEHNERLANNPDTAMDVRAFLRYMTKHNGEGADFPKLVQSWLNASFSVQKEYIKECVLPSEKEEWEFLWKDGK
eukprot:TRINITY_DN15159_c0_g1_i1.p1 TRINITY_DN15159_c0_g1~~TRINITY_DN15159_c0_g1_i1.p1  ORF type:complete len:417 (+),score=25.64 TRINITY_DN15159_c0_g1_i1:36-1286(+)